MSITNIKHYRQHIGSNAEKFFKDTIFQGDQMMVGINCLDSGQVQPVHDHADQDKVYIVMEGRGWFTVGEDEYEAGAGEIVWAPAGVPHGVANRGKTQLVIIVNMAPPPKGK